MRLTTNIHASKTTRKFLYTGGTLSIECSTENKIYGILGGGLPNVVNTERLNVGSLKGKYGETVIGGILNILALENKDMFAFHSVAAPNNQPGETDHILLYKNKLILVETKTYGNFQSFNVSKEGELKGTRVNTGTVRKLDNNNLIEKVSEYEKLFPEYTIHAITAITRSDIKTSSENGKYKVVSLADILQSINYHIERATDVTEELNTESIKYLVSNCLI
jgi:hypothetical protein